MLTSTRILLTYRALGLIFVGLSVALAYLIWTCQPMPGTLGELLRPIGIVCALLAGLVEAICTVTNRLARRVVRRLQHKGM